MLVKALRLRHKGERLSAEDVRAQELLLGRLRYQASPYQGRDGRGALTCLVMPVSDSVEPLIQLHHARVKRIDHRGITIAGTEDVYRRKERTSYDQVMWCWPVGDAELQPPAPDPIDAEEAALELAAAVRGY